MVLDIQDEAAQLFLSVALFFLLLVDTVGTQLRFRSSSFLTTMSRRTMHSERRKRRERKRKGADQQVENGEVGERKMLGEREKGVGARAKGYEIGEERRQSERIKETAFSKERPSLARATGGHDWKTRRKNGRHNVDRRAFKELTLQSSQQTRYGFKQPRNHVNLYGRQRRILLGRHSARQQHGMTLTDPVTH